MRKTAQTKNDESQLANVKTSRVIDQAIADGHRAIDVCIWNDLQHVPAKTYVDACSPTDGLDVQIITTNEPIQTGEIIDGRFKIRYNFGGSSSGGGGS
jgi:hypothetical protein